MTEHRRPRFLVVVVLLLFSPAASTSVGDSDPFSFNRVSGAAVSPQRQRLNWITQLFTRWRSRRRRSPKREEKQGEQAAAIDIYEQALQSTGLSPRRNVNIQLRPEKILRITASGIQIGLLCWLGSMIWRAVIEVVQEFNAEINNDDPILYKREQVEGIIRFFQQDPAQAQKQIDDPNQQDDLPPIQLLQLAHKLVLTGMPITSSDPDVTSLQSVLTSITRNQASLLQQCLWTPLPQIGSAPPLSHIAGLHPIKERLLSALSMTLQKDQHHRQQDAFAPLFDNAASTGILLFGPPGCGKTLLVKSLASTSKVPCLVVTPSVLRRKYYGETTQQVKTLFSLTHLLAPCIVCMDELDGLFRERSDEEHEASRDLKTEFLQWWDGVLSKNSAKRILIIGATNRPFDVDAAVLRRLPQSHFVGLPDAGVRAVLLKQLLAQVPNTCSESLEEIASQTEGYTPSDLKQVLQTAALMGPMRETEPRPLAISDLQRALQITPPSPLSQSYRFALGTFCKQQHASGPESPYFPDNNSLLTQTDTGNFYNAGTIHVDPETFDSLSDLVNLLDSMSDDDSSNNDDDDSPVVDEDDDDTNMGQ